MSIIPKSPSCDWLYDYCEPKLVEGKAYAIDKTKVLYKLDQNECPDDWPRELKEKEIELEEVGCKSHHV